MTFVRFVLSFVVCSGMSLAAWAEDGIEFIPGKSSPTPGTAPRPAVPRPPGLAPVPAKPTAPPGWDLTKASDGSFQIYLPAKPTYGSEDIETAIGPVKMHTYIVELNEGNTAYGMIYSDYPGLDLDLVDPDEMLLGAQEGLLSRFPGATLNTERKIKLGNFPGRDLEFVQRSGGETIYGAWRLYMVRNRMYQVSIISVNNKIDAEMQKSLFANFQAK